MTVSRFPTPDTPHPVTTSDGTTITMNVFLNAVIDHPSMTIGDYSYASDFDPPDDPADWASRLAPYLFPGAPDRLTIGKFCQFAQGVRFITHGANHFMDGFSTFPFAIHDPERFAEYADTLPAGRDTVVGNDVWLGMDVKVLPGAIIGHGVIAGAGAVIAGTVPDYAIVAGNRAEIVRMRFDAPTIERLLAIRWWDWEIGHILKYEDAITGADLALLEAAADMR